MSGDLFEQITNRVGVQQSFSLPLALNRASTPQLSKVNALKTAQAGQAIRFRCAVILTAHQTEYFAVQKHLSERQEEIHKGTVYERGKFIAHGREWEIGIAEIGAGNDGAASEAERAIAYFNADIILFVGVAGGIKDVAIGDVVAATKVYGYESGKAASQFLPCPDLGQTSHNLEQRARSERRKKDWRNRLKSSFAQIPHVHVAPIAAGAKVVSSNRSSVFKFLQRQLYIKEIIA